MEIKNSPTQHPQQSPRFDGLLLAKLFGGVDPSKEVHRLAQLKLWTIGKELGFFSSIEYGIPDLTQEGRRSYIDVVWKSRNGIEFAFEIRRKLHDLSLITTVKDVDKLKNLLASRKFVVNVSELTGKAYFCEVLDESTVPVSQPISRMRFDRPSSKNTERKKVYSYAEKRREYPRAYEKWTPQEDTKLVKLYREGLTVSQLVESHQRNHGAIRSRLIKLGLIQPDSKD